MGIVALAWFLLGGEGAYARFPRALTAPATARRAMPAHLRALNLLRSMDLNIRAVVNILLRVNMVGG